MIFPLFLVSERLDEGKSLENSFPKKIKIYGRRDLINKIPSRMANCTSETPNEISDLFLAHLSRTCADEFHKEFWIARPDPQLT